MVNFSAKCMISDSVRCKAVVSWHCRSVPGVTETKTDYPGPDGEGWVLQAVCFWINRLFLACSVSYLICRWIYYCRLIALQPIGTRPSASGRICTCELKPSKRAQTKTTHRQDTMSWGLIAGCSLSHSGCSMS